jgi:hypothetical protein
MSSQIHIVSFDNDNKITQIRLNWDQGSLLKLIDVIGKTGRNWPIRDGKDQAKLIISSVTAAAKPATGPPVAQNAEETLRRSRENSTNVTRDPHASLALFAPRDADDTEPLPAVVAPRASAKPAPRDYGDLFVGHDNETARNAAPQNEYSRPSSPSKSGVMAPKGGAGKNYQRSRIFDNDENYPIRPEDKAIYIRPNAKKFQHFDIAAAGSEGATLPKSPAPRDIKGKNGTNWNFDDFSTPAKLVPGKVLRGQDVVHWGNEDDVVLDSPIRMKKVDHPRKDAETHFEFADDGIPAGERRLIGRPRGAGAVGGMGLYQNNLYDEDPASSVQQDSRPLATVTNIKDRRKDFDPHFEMVDDSPLPVRNKAVQPANQKENEAPGSPSRTQGINIAGDGMGSRKVALPDSAAVKPKGITIGGDGMGGKKGAGRSWGFGDESDGEETGGVNGAGGAFRKGVSATGKKFGNATQTGSSDFWDF